MPDTPPDPTFTPPDPTPALLLQLAQAFPQLQESLSAIAPPRWKFSETLPTLSKTNFDAWECALRYVLREHDLSILLEPTFDISNYEGTEKDFMEKACASCTRMISAHLDPAIFELIPGSLFRESPHHILTHLKGRIKKDNSLMHSILKAEARALKMTDEITIENYIEKHLALRAKMVSANYPEISDEKITIRFVINGLSDHPLFGSYVGGWHCYGLPTTIDDLHQRLHACNEYHNKTDPTKALSPAGGFHAPNPGRSPYNHGRKYNPRGRGGGGNQRYRPGRGRYGQPSALQQDVNKILEYVENQQGMKPAPKAGRQKRFPKAKAVKRVHFDDTIEEDPGHTPFRDPSPPPSRKYTLDCAAHPSHVNHPLRNMAKLQRPLTTLTATSLNTSATHQGTLSLTSDLGSKLRIPSIVNPKMTANLISANQLCKQYGHILLSQRHGYVLNTNNPSKGVIVATADWRNGEYQMNVTNSDKSTTTRSARTHPSNRATTAPTESKHSHPQKPLPHPSPPSAPANPQPIASNHQPNTRDCLIEPLSEATTRTTSKLRLPDTFHPHSPASPHAAAFHAWHLIFNHLDLRTLQKMAKQQLIPLPSSLQLPPPKLTCSGCANGKARPKPFKRTTHNYAIGLSISSDVCGPISPISTHGNKYFVTFIDTASRYAKLYFTATRKEVLSFIKATISLIKTVHGVVPHLFTSDNAGEYLSKNAVSFLTSHGITAQATNPYSPQQNSIAERLNSTLMQAARSTLYHSKLPHSYWEDALRDAVFKYNLSMHSATQQLPYTLWFGHPPHITRLYPFGQLGTATIITSQSLKSKLSPRSFPARYMFAVDMRNIMVLNTATRQYKRIRNDDFRPYHPSTDPVHTHSKAFKCHIPPPDPSQITQTTPPPSSRKQAHRYPDAAQWGTAHDQELDKLDQEGAIKWVPDHLIPKSAKLVPLLMTYRYKRTPTGALVEHKARCALRGDLMVPRVHYDPAHTTAFMADKTTVRLTLALKAALGLHIEHFDIKSAFVQESYPFEKPVYVKQHPRFDGSHKHSCKAGLLLKNLYGGPSGSYYYLRGAEQFLASIGFSQCSSDPCLFFYMASPTDFIIITLNIDDFLVIATRMELIDNLHRDLMRKYPQRVKRLGPPTQYLGWKIDYLPCGALKLSQPQYIVKALHSAKMQDANCRPSPHVQGLQYHGPTETDKQTPQLTATFQSILGELRYLADCTRPDIAYHVNRLASAAHQPTRRHWIIMKNVLRYLKQTLYEGIVYKPFITPPPTNDITSYADADFAGDRSDRKSTSGSVHLFNNSPIAWNSTKQAITALSTCEAEYVSATIAVQVTQWLRRMLSELRRPPSSPTPLMIDNQAAITVATKTVPTRKRKCIDVKHHYLQEHLKLGHIVIRHVPSTDMLADIFTKPLGPTKFVALKRRLNICASVAAPV